MNEVPYLSDWFTWLHFTNIKKFQPPVSQYNIVEALATLFYAPPFTHFYLLGLKVGHVDGDQGVLLALWFFMLGTCNKQHFIILYLSKHKEINLKPLRGL